MNRAKGAGGLDGGAWARRAPAIALSRGGGVLRQGGGGDGFRFEPGLGLHVGRCRRSSRAGRRIRQQCRTSGGNSDLSSASAFASLERFPLDWARTQNALGIALALLGERESGTRRLEEAVTAYRAALEERRRDQVPLDWAKTQSNLGNALRMLGERTRGTQYLMEAIAAHRAALEEQKRDLEPLVWANTQNNLGGALFVLGERELHRDPVRGTEYIVEAEEAFQAALEERRRDRVPLDWAQTQSNLGATLKTIGEWEWGTQRLEEAVAALRAALGEQRRDRVPLEWARTQNILGGCAPRDWGAGGGDAAFGGSSSG